MIAGTTALLGLLPGALSVAVFGSAAFGAVCIAVTGLILISAAATYHHQPAAGVGLAFLTLALGQSIGGSVLGSLMSMSGAAVPPVRVPATFAGG